MLLDEVTDVVQSRRSDVCRSTFQTVRQRFHLLEVFVVKRRYNVLHDLVETHALQVSKHHVEDAWFAS